MRCRKFTLFSCFCYQIHSSCHFLHCTDVCVSMCVVSCECYNIYPIIFITSLPETCNTWTRHEIWDSVIRCYRYIVFGFSRCVHAHCVCVCVVWVFSLFCCVTVFDLVHLLQLFTKIHNKMSKYIEGFYYVFGWTCDFNLPQQVLSGVKSVESAPCNGKMGKSVWLRAKNWPRVYVHVCVS